MFDKKTSCLLRGIVGVIFGFLALMLPGETQATFYGVFWILIILGIALFAFLAITANGEESMLWFGLAAVLLVIGVLSILIAQFLALMFILVIAAVALYNGFSDITLALTQPKTKYILIPAMILAGLAFLGVLFYYFPGFEKNLFLSVLGTFALVFGLFSIMLGFYKPGEDAESDKKSSEKTVYASCHAGKKH
jgi:uncharacterized membrane protein HdeD (DUF308 family)